ncbi:uncharacterized protein [Arachis hypogaea]|uniref:uncharacterized protein isoform X3 n=1 Tax=Arachis hypogaea TaxID=3818 RepID=UPI003B225AD4
MLLLVNIRAVLFIDNAIWDGVPFLMKAGKALHTKRKRDYLEMRIQRYLGKGIAFLQYEELTKLEGELQSSVARVRKRQEKDSMLIEFV